jgi:hypothetical protein
MASCGIVVDAFNICLLWRLPYCTSLWRQLMLVATLMSLVAWELSASREPLIVAHLDKNSQ